MHEQPACMCYPLVYQYNVIDHTTGHRHNAESLWWVNSIPLK